MTHYTKAEDVVPGDFLLNKKETVKVTRVDRSPDKIVLHLSNGLLDTLKPTDKVAIMQLYDDNDD